MILFTDSLFTRHETPAQHPETPGRATAIVAGLTGLGEARQAVPGAREDVIRVHDPDYVAFLEQAAAEGGGALDPDTWVSPESFAVALAAAGTVCAATDAALEAGPGSPEQRSFSVVRPPGHHARPGRGMGFCLFNNVAVAAARAVAEHGLERVAVVDFDVHHGNGTQEAFYGDPSVFFASLHRGNFYPGTGAADETGSGQGQGTTLNLPLSVGTSRPAYREAFQRTLAKVEAWRPQLVIASAGFDAWDEDPVGGLGLQLEDFHWIGQQLRALADACCQGRLVSALEGGYDLDALGELARVYLLGVEGQEVQAG